MGLSKLVIVYIAVLLLVLSVAEPLDAANDVWKVHDPVEVLGLGYRSTYVIVKLRANKSVQQLQREMPDDLAQSYKMRTIQPMRLNRYFKLFVQRYSNIPLLADQLEQRLPDIVEVAHDDPIGQVFDSEPDSSSAFRPFHTNDPLFDLQYGLDNSGQEINDQIGTPDMDVDAPEAWGIYRGSRNRIVAIIDSGIDDHPDLFDNVWINNAEYNGIDGVDDDHNGYIDDYRGWNTYSDTNETYDGGWFTGHGTAVASIVAAHGNNNLGISGANSNAQVMSIKAFPMGFGSQSSAADAILYAIDNGASLANMSFGWFDTEGTPYFLEAISKAYKSGLLMIAAVGNSGQNGIAFPANHKNILAVAATNNKGEVAGFSSYGAGTNVFAPGESILSCQNLFSGGGYVFHDGTSFSAPLVTGFASLVWDYRPGLSIDELWQILESTTTPIKDVRAAQSAGQLNAYRALRAAAQYKINITP